MLSAFAARTGSAYSYSAVARNTYCEAGGHTIPVADYAVRALMRRPDHTRRRARFRNCTDYSMEAEGECARLAAGVSLRRTNSWTTLLRDRSAVLIPTFWNVKARPRFDAG